MSASKTTPAFRPSEPQFRALIQHAAQGIALLDATGTFLFASRACESLTGTCPDDLVGQNVLKLVHPLDQTAATEALVRCAGTPGLPCSADVRYQRKNGLSSFLEVTLTNCLEDAQLGAIVATFSDTTDRQRARQALIDSEERYRYLFDSSPVPMCVRDIETDQFLDVNSAFVEQYGYSRDELLAMRLQDILPPEAIAAFNDRQKRRGGNIVIDFVTRHRKKGGRVIDVEVTSHVLIFAGRGARLSLVTDITIRKQAEDALERSEERYRSLVEHIPDSVFSLDLDQRYTAANQSACRALGGPVEQIIGKTHSELGLPAKTVEEWAVLLRGVAAGEVVEGVTSTPMPDGQTHTYEYMLRPMLDHEGHIIGASGISHDVTQQRLLEAQFRQAQKMEAIGRLAGGVAHDFNNLLTAIVGYTELLKERLVDDDDGREDLAEIRAAADRAAALTGQLLAFSRKQMQQLEVLDLNAVVGNVREMLHRLIGADIDFIVACPADLGAVKADAGQIEQILLNLAVNARDAMPNGGKLVIETANVELDEEYAERHAGMLAGRYVMLAVSDTGHGMNADVKAHLFEPFFTTKERGKGTGLGLATVYGIVKQSGGYISVYSEPGHGTAFKIYLPRLVEPAVVVPDAGAASDSRAVVGSGTILLVEDQDSVRNLAATVLARRGYRVLTAENGQRALEYCLRGHEPIDLLVTDVMMPGMSGLDLVKRLRPDHADLKVLYISGYNEEAVVQHGVIEPGTAFLQKPFTPDVFVQTVADTLAAQR